MWIRRDAPALLMLPGFVFGQSLPILSLIGASGAVWFKRWLLAAGLILGTISSAFLFPPMIVEVAHQPVSYVVTVRDVRYPKVGVIEFVARVSGAMTDQGAAHIEYPFLANFRAIHLAWRNSNLIVPGARLIVRGNLVPVATNGWPWSFDAHLLRHGVKAVGKAELISELLENSSKLEAWREAISAQGFIDEAHGLVWSLAVGTRDVVSQDTERIFKQLGLSHLLVFSGFQVVLVGGLMARLVKQLLLYLRLARRADLIGGVFGIIASIALTIVSGWEPSGIRAVLALAYGVVTQAILGEKGSALQRLSVAAIALSILLPGALFEPGVELTFVALLGFITSPLDGVVCAAVVATIFTSFIALIWFGDWSPIALLLNPMIAPLLTLTGCLLAYPVLLLSFIFPEIGTWCVGHLGSLNLAIMQTLAWLVPQHSLLEPQGISKIITLSGLGAVILCVLCEASARYFKRNGVSFANSLKRI